MAKPSIFITGAGRGIGRATARLFAEKGYVCGLADVDHEAALEVRRELGPDHFACALDVRDFAAYEAALRGFDAHASLDGRLSVLFNCAGILRMGRLEDQSLDDDRAQLDVNVLGVIHGVRAALPYLERARGTIVSMSSASAIYGQPELAVYSATKFAVRALTEALDLELASKGIRVTDVMPAYVATDMVASQRTPAKSVATLGVRITADEVARRVYEAANGSRLHYPMPFDLSVLSRIATLAPSLTRRVMKHLTKS
ncbi:MAG: SDR family oxidoreductase [Myxococcales bacterium]|nr:SDR family oxidoreductase [Myxococcales bacterium]